MKCSNAAPACSAGRGLGRFRSGCSGATFGIVHCGWNESPVEALSSRGKRGGDSVLEDLPVILVVEDDPLIHAIVEEALSEGGYEVVIASAGEKAVDLLGASDGKYRALVTDINLGKNEMTGWDVARRAREINPSFPVVYMSGDSAEDWASMGVPESIMLSKPFAPAQLVTAVSQLLNSGTSTV
jgi:CheY-like chemotaxis protein